MKRWRWPLLGVLVVAMLVALAARSRHEIWLRWSVWNVRRAALHGEPILVGIDREVVEALAFDRETADERTRSLRQLALDEVWRHDTVATDERIIRYLLDARGLDRPGAFEALQLCTVKNDALVDAAIEVMRTDPLPEATRQCCRYLGQHRERRALPALRAALRHPHQQTRAEACSGLANMPDPASVAPLRHALEDEYFIVRLAAALALGESYADASGLQVLVDALERPPYCRQRALAVLGLLRDRRCVAAIASALDEYDLNLSPEANRSLELITGATLPREQTWSDWFEAHRSGLPEQLSGRSRPSPGR